MTRSVDDVNLITHTNVNEYFNYAIHEAISHQQITANEETVVYIINLLTHYTLSENAFDIDEEGTNSKPLAIIYKDAHEATSTKERTLHLRKLGDIALFTSGFFSESLERRAVGVDYFISMGGTAYSCLAEHHSFSKPNKTMREVFTDLAEHFLIYVDVLTEVSESSELSDDRDVLSLYESWLKTGSVYARQRLLDNGIHAFPLGHKKH